MPEKSKSPKPKIKKPARTAAVARRKFSPPQAKPAFYVTCAEIGTSIFQTQPRGLKDARQFATFNEAKSAAVEALIDAIERAEEQLAALKHANRYDELSSAH
ncbi:MAG: hypothetical protein HY288_13645 [Planctomycetia bacterium]|nr:hypothetical protein [Planctomycetia bacterium]